MIDLHSVKLQKTYQEKAVVNNVDLLIERGKIYSIIGPNGCGKSTLLKMLTKQINPTYGEVYIQSERLKTMPLKALAKKIATLSQHQPELDLTVRELVRYGRTPYQKLFKRYREQDEQVVDWAISQTNLTYLQNASIQTLSGGERQRAWIALALSQEPKVLLLDEPTTYLDIAHQFEVLEVMKRLNHEHGVTVVMVLHDMNHAALFSDEIIVMKNGQVFAIGEPNDVMTENMFRDVFSISVKIVYDDELGKPAYLLQGLLT